MEAVRGVDIEVAAGEFVAMAGPSGSREDDRPQPAGRIDRPSRGKVWIAGREISALPDRELAKVRLSRIGFVFQSYNLLPVLTASEKCGVHHAASGGCPPGNAASGCGGSLRKSGWRVWRTGSRRSYPAGSSSGWRWRARCWLTGSGAGRRADGQPGFVHGRGAPGRDGKPQPREGDDLRVLDPRPQGDGAGREADPAGGRTGRGVDGSRPCSMTIVTQASPKAERFVRGFAAPVVWAALLFPASATAQQPGLSGYYLNVFTYLERALHVGRRLRRPAAALHVERSPGPFRLDAAYEHTLTLRQAGTSVGAHSSP